MSHRQILLDALDDLLLGLEHEEDRRVQEAFQAAAAVLQLHHSSKSSPWTWKDLLQKTLELSGPPLKVESVFEKEAAPLIRLEWIVNDLIRSGSLGIYRRLGGFWIVPALDSRWLVEEYQQAVVQSLLPGSELHLAESETSLRALLEAVGVSGEKVTQIVSSYHDHGGYSNPPGEG